MPSFSRPGLPGITYLYGHSAKGMFASLLQASWSDNGTGLLGAKVRLYTADGLLRVYEVVAVYRHQRGYTAIDALSGDALVLQTCETVSDTGPKLLVVARLTGPAVRVSMSDANPVSGAYTCGWA
jgi:hypothetical protein